MERTEVVPHMSWIGPQPDNKVDAYLLAMLVRIYSSGMKHASEEERDRLVAPSVLTPKNLRIVAIMYAFYHSRMDDVGAKTVEDMLKLVKACEEDDACAWLDDNEEAIRRAEVELLEYVDTEKTSGFRCFG